jgi:hypothetical protein
MPRIRVILQLHVSGMVIIAAMVDPHAFPKWTGIPKIGVVTNGLFTVKFTL